MWTNNYGIVFEEIRHAWCLMKQLDSVVIQIICHYFVDIDACASTPCQNGGTCTDTVNGYTCGCAAGYKGVLCETGMSTYLYYCATHHSVTCTSM